MNHNRFRAVKEKISCVTPDHEMIINATVHGLGLAVVPVFYIRHELANGQLHMPFGEPVKSDDSYFLVYPERKTHNPNIIVFRDWLLRSLRRPPQPRL